MKYKGIILIVLIVIALAVGVSSLISKDTFYKEIATVGSPAPDFELKDSNGNLWKLSDLRGKVVFINFWATWCSTCKREQPYKESLYQKMQDRPFQMFGILYNDSPRNLRRYFTEYNISAPTLINQNDTVARLYGVTGIPETFIIDKNGIIRKKVVGPRKWDSPEAIAFIEKWMQ